MLAAPPAYRRSEASTRDFQSLNRDGPSSIRTFLQQTRLRTAIVEPLPEVDSMAVHVEEVSHTARETATDYVRRDVMAALPDSHRDARDRVFRRSEREKNQLDRVAAAAPPVNPSGVRVAGKRGFERETAT